MLPLPQLQAEKADPGSPVLLVPAREGGREGLRGGNKVGAREGAGWGGRPTISHRECMMLSSQYGDANDDCQNEDSDGHTDGNQYFLL